MAILCVACGTDSSGSAGTRSKRCALVLLALALVVLALPLQACPAPMGPASTVIAVAQTGEVSLADGRIVRLSGIDWPSPDRQGWRDRLRMVLLRLAAGTQARVDSAGKSDRWGRLSGNLVLATPDGPPQPLWVQETLVALGLVRHWPEAATDPCRPRLLAAENAARAAGLGLWSPLSRRTMRVSRVVARQTLSGRAVFEARVRSVRTGRSATFVNFEGTRSATPFIMVRNRDLSRWRAEGLDPATFSGKRLRVRGVVSQVPTPRLHLTGPMAVEVLE